MSALLVVARRRYALWAVPALFLVPLAILHFSTPDLSDRPPTAEMLVAQARATAALRAGIRNTTSGGILDLTSVAPVEWDTFYTVPAYSCPEGFKGTIGFEWTDCGQSKTSGNDLWDLMLFVKGNAVVLWLDLDRSDARFEMDTGAPVLRSHPLVRVWKDGPTPVITRDNVVWTEPRFDAEKVRRRIAEIDRRAGLSDRDASSNR